MWINIKKKKRQLNETCLIYMQGIGEAGNHWDDHVVAAYVIYPWDRCRKCFIPSLHHQNDATNPWVFDKVTHWMSLPEPPGRI